MEATEVLDSCGAEHPTLENVSCLKNRHDPKFIHYGVFGLVERSAPAKGWAPGEAPVGWYDASAPPSASNPPQALPGVMTGEICGNCGTAAMVRTGKCLTCQACGSDSGGCS